MWVSASAELPGHAEGMRVHVPVGVIEDTDGYLHAAEQRTTGPIALCGAGHIRERWAEEFDTEDPRSCPICMAIISGGPPTPRPRSGRD